MDVFNSNHICNHSDDGGRYSYANQPAMIVFAMRKLLNALAPIVGFEETTGKAPQPGWDANLSDKDIEKYTATGLELQSELDSLVQMECADEYAKRMHARLGLRKIETSDERELARPLLDLMSEHKLDFHITFRTLCDFAPSVAQDDAALTAFVERLHRGTPDPTLVDRKAATAAWEKWLKTYAARIEAESDAWAAAEDRAHEMRQQNPRFVLRQWVLEEVIRRVERDPDSGRRVLRKVLHVSCPLVTSEDPNSWL
jgi:uncharacterized protein YdiU (UPF0061 family)